MLIWQLGTDEFPPLRTLDELPGNLPVQRTSFVGRADEVKELAALVGHGAVGDADRSGWGRQVASGVAGRGRGRAGVPRRRVVRVARRRSKRARWWRRRSSKRWACPNVRASRRSTRCARGRRTREALVVIDNCEHLLAEVAAVVDRMLEASTTVSVLATSQAPLGVRGEHVWAVAPLSGPRRMSRDSVELFVDRARMARADFELTDENEAAVVEICERLDHVPLAIELAAARVRGMTPADIARRLDQRLRLLTSTDRLAPGRHRTLDAAVRWSYELLDETQQRVFDRLSVFAGPFTIEAAEAVVAGDGVDEWEVLDAVLALVDKSLVVADENDRRHALSAVGDDAPVRPGQPRRRRNRRALYRDRHADYYADFVLSRRPQLHGSGDLAALEAVERELENIRVALRHAADDHTSSRFEELISSLFTLWSRGRHGRARRGPPSSCDGPVSTPRPASWRSASPRRS